MNVKNIKTRWKFVFALFVLSTLISCSTVQVGKDFTIKMFAENVVLGKTTKTEVSGWLGKPMSTGISQKEDGQRLIEWDYFYGTGKLPDMKDSKLKMLQVRFDKDGIVRSYNWSSGM